MTEIIQIEPRQTDLAFPPQPEKEKRKKLLRRLETLRKAVIKRDAGLEWAHAIADELLLKYIGDPEISRAFKVIPKWYS